MNGLTYTQPIGIWGQRRLDYLKQYRRVIYINLLTSGKLNTYLPALTGKRRNAPTGS